MSEDKVAPEVVVATAKPEVKDVVHKDTDHLCGNDNASSIACLINFDEQKIVMLSSIGEHRSLIFIGDTEELNLEGIKVVFPEHTPKSLTNRIRYLKAIGALCLDGKGVLRANQHVASVIRRVKYHAY